MTLSEFTLRIVLIFLPGLIAFIIVEQLTIHKETPSYRFFIYSFLLGITCYILYYPLSAITFLHLKFSFIKSLSNNKLVLDFKEIFVSTLLAIPLGFIVSFFINKKVLHKTAHKLRISRKYGDLDVWGYLMNSQMPEWLVIRDIGNDLMYEGWVHAFSDASERDELFLRDVKVFKNKSGEELYEIPGLYLPQNRDNFTIEFPAMKFSKYRERKTENNQEAKE